MQILSRDVIEQDQQNSKMMEREEHEEKEKQKKNLMELKNELFMTNFDFYRGYDRYFPHNNPIQVVLKLNLRMRQLMRRDIKLASLFHLIGTQKRLALDSPVHDIHSPRKRR